MEDLYLRPIMKVFGIIHQRTPLSELIGGFGLIAEGVFGNGKIGLFVP
jgi:hypothetical protein